MKVDEKQLAQFAKDIAKTGGGDIPEWINKIESIVKNVNEMLGVYNQMSGKQSPPVQQVQQAPQVQQSFIEARAIKKAEMASKNPPKVEAKMSDDFKEILEGLIKACNTLDQLGYSEKTIGEAIMSLPINIGQAKAFLIKLYNKKYGS